MTFAEFQENRFRIDGEIAENHAILVNLTASIVTLSSVLVRETYMYYVWYLLYLLFANILFVDAYV